MSAETKPVVTSLTRSTSNSEQYYELKPVVSSVSEASSIPELISYLKSAFRDNDFSLVQGILMDREKQLRAEIENLKRDFSSLKKERDFSDKVQAFVDLRKLNKEKQLKDIHRKYKELKIEKAKVEAKLKTYEKKFEELDGRMSLLEEETAKNLSVDTVIQKMVVDLEAEMDDVVEVNCQASGADGDSQEKQYSPRALPVDSTGNGSGKSGDEDPLPFNLACENRAPIIDLSACEAGDWVKNNLNTVSGRGGSSTVVHISNSGDENAKACVSKSNDLGRNLTFPHQIKENIKESLSKRKRLLSESDNSDVYSFGKQKPRSIQELDCNGKLSFAHDNSHKTVLLRRFDDKDGGKSYSQLSSRRSDIYKLDGSSDDSSSDPENDPLSDKSMDIFIKSITKRKMFSSEDGLRSSFEKDPELCMNAICALYRQQISPNISSKGLHFTKSWGLSQSDEVSITAFGEFLIDGDPENKLRKAVDEVRLKDHAECKRLATKYCHQLYQIYLSKEDHLFCLISKF